MKLSAWVFFFLFVLSFQIFSEEKINPAYLIADQIKKGLESKENKFISSLISGIEARAKGILLSPDELRTYSFFIAKQREFIAQKNLCEANHWMADFQSQKTVHTIIPSKLAYSLIKKGNGALLDQKSGKVSVNYTIKKVGEYFPEAIGKEKDLDLREVIPGLAHGMLSMREGEIRTIYIHPELAYQTYNFDPNIVLEATVELLQILPDSVEIPFLGEIPDIEIPLVTEDELDQLQLKDYYVLGWRLWDHLRWGYKLFTKEDVILALQKELLPGSYNEEINKIHWKIYHQRIEDEYNNADFYLKKLSLQSEIKCLVPGYLYCKAQKLRETPSNENLFKARITINDREGKILRNERLEVINVNDAIKGLKEGLPYLIPQEETTLFIHPKWAYRDIDGPLGDTFLIVDVVLE